MKIQKTEIFFLLVFFISLFLAFNKHSGAGINNYHSQLWADPSGYYVYLPATFIYGFHASDFPKGTDENVGIGFNLDQITNKVTTKYTLGVAILFLPFFLIAHLIAIIFSLDPSGFSPVYYKMIDVGAVFYLTMGLYFLTKFLYNYFSKATSIITVLILFLSTNLYYYSISSPFFTHVYSFFLFSLFLYVLKKHFIEKAPELKQIFLFGIICALIVLIRPTNIIFLITAFFIDISSFAMLMNRIRLFLKPKSIVLIILAGFIIFLPQSLYWHFLTGHFVAYTYKGEGFDNWNSPKIIEVLFAPTNGLIVWTPIFLLIIISIILSVIRNKKNAIPALFAFSILLYLCASWHVWYFGCGFSQRSFVEYLAIFSFPVAYGLEYLSRLKRCFIKNSIYFIILFLIYFNLKMIYYYDVCFFGGVWDWKEYSNYFDKSRMFGFTSNQYTFFNSFDGKNWNPKVVGQQSITKTGISYSGEEVCKIDTVNIFSSGCESVLNKIGHRPIKSAEVSFQAYFLNSSSGFNIVCEIDSAQKQILFLSKDLSSIAYKVKQWEIIKHRFLLPADINQFFTIKVYVLNTGKDSMLMDDLKIVFKY